MPEPKSPGSNEQGKGEVTITNSSSVYMGDRLRTSDAGNTKNKPAFSEEKFKQCSNLFRNQDPSNSGKLTKYAKKVVQYLKNLENQPISLSAMLILVARFGGYLNRKLDPSPGSTTLWIGLQKLRSFVQACQVYDAMSTKSYG